MLADKLGMLLINEIPPVDLNFADTDELITQRLTQCIQRLSELITRDKNDYVSVSRWLCLALS